MKNSRIEWTDHTFNPWIGCTKVSAGCANCYAERMLDIRLGSVKWGGARKLTSDKNWSQPIAWSTKSWASSLPRVFCASLADVWDDAVPASWLRRLLWTIKRTPYLRWMLLTKRPQLIVERLLEASDEKAVIEAGSRWNVPHGWGPHESWFSLVGFNGIWLGISAEDQHSFEARWPHVVRVPAAVHFVSAEPLLGRIDFWSVHSGKWPDWVIVGGESGPGARPMYEEWARSIKDQCMVHGIRFFFKQWGGVKKNEREPILDGCHWVGIP